MHDTGAHSAGCRQLGILYSRILCIGQ